MSRIFFDSLNLMLQHAKANGGWCAVCSDGSFQWFAPGRWTLTPIMHEVVRNGGHAEIGPWTRFEKGSNEQ